jgi:ribosomal protein S18 acetylase RimI-like enzyme
MTGERGHFTLRPEVAEDEPFLRRLYTSTREEELAVTGWSDAEKAAFLAMQFDARRAAYLVSYPCAERSVVLVGSVPAGRLLVLRTSEEIRIVDVALLPEHRGLGLGTAILTPVLEEARASGRPVRIHVDRTNRAQSLYARLGFAPVSDAGPYQSWERPPTG